MKKKIALVMLMILPMIVLADSGASRSEIAKKLTENAKKAEVRIEFSVDPNDDKTLMLYRVSTFRPSELSGDWTMYLLSVGTTTEQLKKEGFNKVRIYTSKSKDVSDYVLEVL